MVVSPLGRGLSRYWGGGSKISISRLRSHLTHSVSNWRLKFHPVQYFRIFKNAVRILLLLISWLRSFLSGLTAVHVFFNSS